MHLRRDCIMLNLFVIMILLSCLFQQHLSTHSAPSFAEIFQSHEGESVLRRSNNIDIYERELALYRTRKEAFPELSLLQIGDDLSMSLPFDDIGGGAGKNKDKHDSSLNPLMIFLLCTYGQE